MFGNTFIFILLFAVSNAFLINDKSELHCIFSKYILKYFELNESYFSTCQQHDGKTECDHSGLESSVENLQKLSVIVMAMLDVLRIQGYSRFPAELMTVNLYLNKNIRNVVQYSNRKGTTELTDDDCRIRRRFCNAYTMITGELRSSIHEECHQKMCYKKIDPRFNELKFRSKSIRQTVESKDRESMYKYLEKMVKAAKAVFGINIEMKSHEDFLPRNMILFQLMSRPKTGDVNADGLNPMRDIRLDVSQENVYMVDLFERIKSSYNGHFLKAYQQQVMAASIYPLFSCASSYLRMFKQLHLTNNGHDMKAVINDLGSEIVKMYRNVVSESFLPYIVNKYVYDIRVQLERITVFYENEPFFLDVPWINGLLSLLSKPMVLNRFNYDSTTEILDTITEKQCGVLIDNTKEEVEMAKTYTEALLKNATPLKIVRSSVNHGDMFQTEPLDIFNTVTEGTICYDSFIPAGENSNGPIRSASGMGTARPIGLASALTIDETKHNKPTSTVVRNVNLGGRSISSKFRRSQSLKLPEKNKNRTSAGKQKERVTLQDLLESSPSPYYLTPLSEEQSNIDGVGETVINDESPIILVESGDEEKAPIPVDQSKCSHEQIIVDTQKEEGTDTNYYEPTVLLDQDIETEKCVYVQDVPIPVDQLKCSYEQIIEDTQKEEGTSTKDHEPTSLSEDIQIKKCVVKPSIPVKQLTSNYQLSMENKIKIDEERRYQPKNKSSIKKVRRTQSLELKNSGRPIAEKEHKPAVLLGGTEDVTDDIVQEVPATVKQLTGSFEKVINDRLALIEKNKYLAKRKNEIVESRKNHTAQKEIAANHTHKTVETYSKEFNDSKRRARRSSIDWENLPRRVPSNDNDTKLTNEEKLKKSMDLHEKRSPQSSKYISPSTVPAKKNNDRGVPSVKRLQKQQSEIFDMPGKTNLSEYNIKPDWDTDRCHGEKAYHTYSNLLNTLKKPVVRKHAGDSTPLHCLFSEYLLTFLKLNEKYFTLKYGQSVGVTYTADNLKAYESHLRSIEDCIMAMLDELRKYEKNPFAFDLMTVNLYLNNLTKDLAIFTTDITMTETNCLKSRRNGLVANYRMLTEQLSSFTGSSSCLPYSVDGFESRFGVLHQTIRRMDAIEEVTDPKKLMPELHDFRVQVFNSLKPTMDEEHYSDFQPANMLFFDLMSGYVKPDDSAKARLPLTRSTSLVDMFRSRRRGQDAAKFDDGLQAIRQVVVNTSPESGESNNSVIDAFYCVSLNFDSNHVRSFQQQVLAATVHPVFDVIAKYAIGFKQVLFLYTYTVNYVKEMTVIGTTLLNEYEKFIRLRLFSDKATKYLTKLLDLLKKVVNSPTKESIKTDQPNLIDDILELCSKPMRLNFLEFKHKDDVVNIITQNSYKELVNVTNNDIVTLRAYVEALSTHRSVFDVVKRTVPHDDVFEKEPLDVFRACQ